MKKYFYYALILLMNMQCLAINTKKQLKDELAEQKRINTAQGKKINQLQKQNTELEKTIGECEEENHRLKQQFSEKIILYPIITFKRMTPVQTQVKFNLQKCELLNEKRRSERAWNENKALRISNDLLQKKFEQSILGSCCFAGILAAATYWWSTNQDDKTA